MKAINVVLVFAALGLAANAQNTNLIQNGSFDDPEDPLRGWFTDYSVVGAAAYKNNAGLVSVVPSESGRSRVMKIQNVQDAGTKAESPIFPFDITKRYRATLYLKGGPYRIYFAGYQWKPGIRPHDDPKQEELRMVYRSKAATGQAKSWEKISLEIPGVEASEQSLKHLQKVRLLRLYVYFHTVSEVGYTGFLDDVQIVQIK